MSSPFQKSFCRKSPFNQKTIGETRRQERQLRRRDRRARKGKLPEYEGNLHWFQ
tara:strand:- start:621 stop:782 length:162 start_codon:yes stop_codon:yes gene_type:complete